MQGESIMNFNGLEAANHPKWVDASYTSWPSCDWPHG